MTDLDPDPGFFTTTARRQLIFGFWVNMTTMVIGLAYGFPTVLILQLSSPPSNFVITYEDRLWINSIAILVCPVGCIITGIVLDNLGRRLPILICNAILCLGWLYMACVRSITQMLIARAIIGVGCGMALEVPRLYTSEISLANMRGFFGALPNVFLSFGILLEVSLGYVITWKKLCFMSCLFSFFLFITYIFLPESPEYLLLENVHHAIQALNFFRSKNYNTDKEHNRLIEFKQNNNIRRLTLKEKGVMAVSKSTCEPFGFVITYLSLACLAGIPLVKYWTSDVLEVSYSSLPTELDTLLVNLVAQVFSILTCVLLYRYRRLPIALTSAIGVGLSSIALGIILRLNKKPSAIPPFMVMVYTFFATLGFQCLPFLFMTELYPLEIRGLMIGISLTWYNVVAFMCLYFYESFYKAIDISVIWVLWGFFALLAAIFLYYKLPEVTGLTLQEVEEYYRGTRPALFSDRKIAVIETQLTKEHNTKQSTPKVDPNIAALIAQRQTDQTLVREKSFVEASPSLTSLRSASTRRSVTLLIGDKTYMTDQAVHDIQEQMKELDELSQTNLTSQNTFQPKQHEREIQSTSSKPNDKEQSIPKTDKSAEQSVERKDQENETPSTSKKKPDDKHDNSKTE